MKNKIQFKNTYIQIGQDPVIELKDAGILNLLTSKGANTKGKIKYVPNLKDFLQEPNREEVAGNIIFCDYIDYSQYPILSALSASGIVTYSINYSDFINLTAVNSAIGVFGGFGQLKFNTVVSEFIESQNGSEIYFDTLYNRVVIPDSKKTKEIEKYEFDLDEIFSYK